MAMFAGSTSPQPAQPSRRSGGRGILRPHPAHPACRRLGAGLPSCRPQGAVSPPAAKPGAGGEAPLIFVDKIPSGYRDWRLISVAHEEGNLPSFAAVLGNDVAIKAYREGKLPFPE